MVEKQVIIDVKEYEELQEWAEAGKDTTEAIKRVLENGNPNEECKTIVLYNIIGDEKTLTKTCICTKDEALKAMKEAHQREMGEMTRSRDNWRSHCYDLAEKKSQIEKKMAGLRKKIEEYNSLPLWKKLLKKIKL